MDEDTLGTRFRNIDSWGADAEQLLAYLDRYASIPAVQAAKRESFELLRLRPGDAVLDVGCGTGDDVIALAELVGPNGIAVGVDRSAVAVEEACRRAEGIRGASFHEAGAEQLPFPAGAFDACRTDRTLQHLADPEAALAELVRVVRPGAPVVVTEVLNVLTVDGAPDETPAAHAILGEMWRRADRRSWVGFMLPLLFARASLDEIGASTKQRTTSSMETIELAIPVRRLARSAVDAGRVEAGDAERWLAGVDSAAARGSIELRTTFLHVYGHKART